MQLRQEEKEILSHWGDWLNDQIMDAAQILLRRQFPYISRFDTVLKAQNLSYDCCPNNSFKQIVNHTAMKGEGSHWLMLSTLDSTPRKEVKLYDSAYESVSFETQEAICNPIQYGQPPCKNDNINLLVMDVDMQSKGEEDTCGFHAIANALSLALGIDPTEISYDERAMHKHLFNCLEEEFLTMFPHSSRSSVHKKGVKKTSILPVFCSCKRPESGFYFECTRCKIWYYPECQNMAQEDISDDPQEPTYCTACQPQQSGKREED